MNIRNIRNIMNFKNLPVFFGLFILPNQMFGKTDIKNMKVEYGSEPIAIATKQPRFSWQITNAPATRGLKQTSYTIILTDEHGKEVWNTGKVTSDQSLNIRYTGESLKPSTRYQWHLTIWDNQKEMATATSHFETAMTLVDNYNHSNPSISGNIEKEWNQAKWIGKGENAIMFYAPYLPMFELTYKVTLDKASKTTKAAFIYGANDPRLMDSNKNLLGINNQRDSSYIKVELDIAPLQKNQEALLNIYRRGYKKSESQETLISSIRIPTSLINRGNQYAPHQVTINTDLGDTYFHIDNCEKHLAKVNLNPTGKSGGDYIAYPVVGDMGFAVSPRQKAIFEQVEVRDFRRSHQLITSFQSTPLSLDGGKKGLQSIHTPQSNAAPMLRTTFETANKKIAKARIYATAHGIYELYVNGSRVSNAYFNPGITQYDKTQVYQTFDVTPFILSGTKNAWGAELAEGWWSGGATFVGSNWNFFGNRQALLAKMEITYEDGTQQTIVTDPTKWKSYDDSPVIYGSFFQGEVYDARKEEAIREWSTPNYRDTHWKQAAEIQEDGFSTGNDYQLLADMAEPIMAIDTLTAQSMEEVRPGVFVYDLGQNLAGVPLLHFKGLTAGTEVKIRTAEIKYPNLPRYKGNEGMIMTENLRVAMSQDIYIAKGEAEETFSPRFTSHGYRYLEITGVKQAPSIEDVKTIALSSITKNSSSYETSNSMVNQLWKNTLWSMRSNFMSVPTDCPQRNERLGWMGDISVFSRSATFLSEVPQFLRRYLISVRDLQSPAGRYPDVAPTGCGFGGFLWGSAGITVPWELYQQYADTALLTEHYESMKRYINFVCDDYISKKNQLLVQHYQWGDLGDWLSLEDGNNDKSLIWECYLIYDLDIMQKMAKVLGREEDAKQYANLAAERRALFNKTYVDSESGKTIWSAYNEKRKGQLVDTQTSYALALAFGVADSSNRAKMVKNFAESIQRSTGKYPAYSLLTGFIGTAWISKALSDYGCSNLAYRLLQQDSFPSWIYPIKNGATTIWERLNSYTKEDGFGNNNSMNSFNHYSFGAVVAWMYNYSLGIRRDENSPGFKHFILQPETDSTGGITHAKGHCDSMYGRINSSWQKLEGRTEYCFTVPANTSATLFLPAKSRKDILESDKKTGRKMGKKIGKKNPGIQYLGKVNGLHKMELLSGEYHFIVME